MMGCSCNSGAGASTIKVLAPNGSVTTWRTQAEADAAAERTGGRVLTA
jgi:hypothetical protein